MSSPDEDHREKNILLAKNLNQVKMNLRSKMKDLLDLRSQLRMEKQRNSKLELDQMSILQRIDFLKHQLDDTFYKNTVGYMHLSKQLDQMHQESVQCQNETSLSSGELNATFTTNNNSVQSTFLDKVKAISESMVSNQTFGDIELNISQPRLSSGSRLSSDRQSLSFNTFSMGLSSAFASEAEDVVGDSVMNCSFLEDSSENSSTNEVATPLTESNQNRLNVTLRRTRIKSRHEKASKMTKKMVQNQLLNEMENQPMATNLGKNSASNELRLRRGGRPVKKIDYNESMRRKN